MRAFRWALLLVPLLLDADQVTLNNGDRISGSIITTDDKTLTLKTAAMGEVKIDRAAITAMSSDEPLTVTLKKGEPVTGRIQSEAANTIVITTDGRRLSFAREDVDAIRSGSAQAAWEREQLRITEPPLLDFWSGSIGLNIASASGNARTTTFGTGATAERKTGFDKISLMYSQIYSKQSTTPPFGATANRVSGGVRYDRDILPRVFAFALNSYDYDRFLNLDLRSVLGGGLGAHVFKSARSYWDVGAGGDWNRESFGNGLVRNSAEVLITEESSHQLTSILKVFQRVAAFPNVTEAGEYRANADLGASLRLTKALSWTVALTDRYLSNPIAGKRKNDVLLTTGIGITFEQK